MFVLFFVTFPFSGVFVPAAGLGQGVELEAHADDETVDDGGPHQRGRSRRPLRRRQPRLVFLLPPPPDGG